MEPDSARVFFLDRDRISRRLTLHELHAATGAVREVITESPETFSDVNLSVTGLPNVRVLAEQNEVIWFSQRDGWAHLYLYNLHTGALKNRITQGEWVVRDIVHVDPIARRILFLAGGIDPAVNPYYRTLCSVGFDGSGFQMLTPEPHDHALAMPQKRSHATPSAPWARWENSSRRPENTSCTRIPSWIGCRCRCCGASTAAW